MAVKITMNGVAISAVAPLEITQELTTELDNATLKYLKTENASDTAEPLSHYRVEIDSLRGTPEVLDFVGLDSRALLRNEGNNDGLYKHDVALTEPSKLLQGLLIDGAGVAQPEALEDRKSLFEVVDRLLKITPLYDYPASGVVNEEFVLTDDPDVVKALEDRISPEFKWNTQTTLWECLVQIGAIIDTVPRLVADANGRLKVVTFDFVNAYDNEIAEVIDGYTNVNGDSVDENQYNTALSSIVENVKEEE